MRGSRALQSGDSEGAAKRFDDIDKQAPFSPYAKRGLILTAYTNYQASKWEETITAARALHRAEPGEPGRGLCAVPDGDVLL